MKILIIEDQFSVAIHLENFIQKEFPNSITKIADNLDEAMEQLAQFQPDVTLLDLTLKKSRSGGISNREETIKRLGEIITICPNTVIVTGTDPETVKDIPGMISSVPIIEKSKLFLENRMLYSIISVFMGKPKISIPEDSDRRSKELLEELRPRTTPNG